jgi:hypothetical protein
MLLVPDHNALATRVLYLVLASWQSWPSVWKLCILISAVPAGLEQDITSLQPVQELCEVAQSVPLHLAPKLPGPPGTRQY